MQLQLTNSCAFSRLTLDTVEGDLWQRQRGDSVVGYSPNIQEAQASTPRSAKEEKLAFWSF